MKTKLKPTLYALTVVIFMLGVGGLSCKKGTSSHAIITKCVTCAYGGTCVNDTCQCPAGYEGTSCETISRDKYLGNWTVFEKGSTSNAAQYQVSILAGTNVTDVSIVNFNNYFAVPITGVVVGDTLFIPNQQYTGKVVFGVGYIYSNVTYGQYGSISLSYEVVDTATLRVDDYGYYSSLDQSSPSAWNK